MRHLKKIISVLILGSILCPIFSEEITFRPCDFYSANKQDDDDDSIFADLFEIITVISFFNNLLTEYDEYPYANGKYINFDSAATYTYTEESLPKVIEHRPFRFACDTSVFYHPEFGAGVNARLEGILYKFIGPVFEYSEWVDSKSVNKLLNEHIEDLHPKGNLRIGAQLSFLQFNPINVYWLLQWSHLFDSDLHYSTKNAFLWGIIIRSYPIKPLLLEFRGTAQHFGSDKSIYESHLEIGFMVKGRWEIFGAWNLSTNEIYKTEYNSLELGTRIHF